LGLQLFKHNDKNKLLLTVGESWGSALDTLIQNAVVQKLLNRYENFVFFERGIKKFNGVTMQAELKELC
jgi:hypothetical protein